MDKTNISYNEDGFPIDEKGNFIQILDENGNCVVFVGRREYDYDEENRFCYCRPIGSNEYDKKIIFSRTDQLQVKKAIKEIAYVLMEGFTGGLESELLPLNPRVDPAKYPTIGIYINEVDSFLNYLGSVYEINFEYSTYIEYKEITRNQLIAAKTKLYNDRAIEKSVSFIENWFSGKDKIYLQKLELINKLEKETPKETESEQTPDVKEQPEIFLDYSDNSAAEKIVFLYELGILEFLMKKEPFNTSTNKLAEVVTAFTGINQTTAQSYLNPIFSSGVDSKNNPLTPKQTKTVTEKLIKMGFIRK